MMSTVEMIAQVSPLTLAEYAEMPYSPAVLLDSQFDASITDHPAFRKACAWGFEDYFEDMYEWGADETETVFVARSYCWEEVVASVVENVLHWKLGDRLAGLPPPAQDAGFVLGWLSALALTDRPMAMRALAMLEALLLPSETVYREWAA